MPQPGDGAARLLRHAVLIDARITLGGIAIDLAAPAFVASALEGLGPFLEPAPFDRQISLRIKHIDDEEGQPGAALPRVYERPGLRFGAGASACEAAIDATLGSFEAALQLTLEAALIFEGGLVVHAAAGVVGGEAWLMPGVSGTGKSTAAREAGFDAVLSDEMCIVRCTAAGPRIHGTPFWSEGRTRPLTAAHAPLGVLARLVQDRHAVASPLPAAEAAAFLLSCVTLYGHDSKARAAAFETACAVAEAARCVTLRFPKEGPWLTAVRAVASRASSSRP